jgi:hypothetical protein
MKIFLDAEPMAASERTFPDGVPNYTEDAALFARPALQAEIVAFKRAVELAAIGRRLRLFWKYQFGGRRLRHFRQCIDDVLYLLRTQSKHGSGRHDSPASEFSGIRQKFQK